MAPGPRSPTTLPRRLSPSAQPRVGGVAPDAAGDIYAANYANGYLAKFPAGGGNPQTIASGLNQPANLAIDGAGDLYIGQNGNASSITEIPSGCASSSCSISIGGDLQYPSGVAVDGAGNVYVADVYGEKVLEFPAGCTTSSCEIVAVDGVTDAIAVAVDGSGNIFVAYDISNVLEVPPGCFNSFSGCSKLVGSNFVFIFGFALDAADDLFVADYAANAIYEVTPAGIKTQLTTGDGAYDIGVDAAGDVFMAYGSSILELKGSQPPSFSFATPTKEGATDTTDGPQSATIANIGNEPLTFFSPTPSISTGFNLGTESTSCDQLAALTLDAGATCTLTATFAPVTPQAGAVSGSISLTDNDL